MWYSLFSYDENKYEQFLKNVVKIAILPEYKDSKSFLSVLILLIRGILYPGAHLFSTAGGKEQAA